MSNFFESLLGRSNEKENPDPGANMNEFEHGKFSVTEGDLAKFRKEKLEEGVSPGKIDSLVEEFKKKEEARMQEATEKLRDKESEEAPGNFEERDKKAKEAEDDLNKELENPE